MFYFDGPDIEIIFLLIAVAFMMAWIIHTVPPVLAGALSARVAGRGAGRGALIGFVCGLAALGVSVFWNAWVILVGFPWIDYVMVLADVLRLPGESYLLMVPVFNTVVATLIAALLGVRKAKPLP